MKLNIKHYLFAGVLSLSFLAMAFTPQSAPKKKQVYVMEVNREFSEIYYIQPNKEVETLDFKRVVNTGPNFKMEKEVAQKIEELLNSGWELDKTHGDKIEHYVFVRIEN